MSKLVNELPKTYQTPTMAPFCEDDVKYDLVEFLVKKLLMKLNNTEYIL